MVPSPVTSYASGQSGRCQTTPCVPHRLGTCPREHGAERPGARVAGLHGGHALTELLQNPLGAAVVGSRHVGGQSEQRFARRVGAIDDEPGRYGDAVDVEPLAVPNEDLTLDRVEARSRRSRRKPANVGSLSAKAG